MTTAKAIPTSAERRRRISAKLDRVSARIDALGEGLTSGESDKVKVRRELDRLHSRVAAITEEIESLEGGDDG